LHCQFQTRVHQELHHEIVGSVVKPVALKMSMMLNQNCEKKMFQRPSDISLLASRYVFEKSDNIVPLPLRHNPYLGNMLVLNN
jgi:hypothetical protein